MSQLLLNELESINIRRPCILSSYGAIALWISCTDVINIDMYYGAL